MSFIYCQSCGTKIEYTTHKPNFCPKCGSPQNSAAQKLPESPNQISEATVTGEEKVPSLSKLEYDISAHSAPETFGSIVGKGSMGPLARKPYVTKHGSAAKDSLEFCRPSRLKDIDESG